jgi:2'-5' RNA ligase
VGAHNAQVQLAYTLLLPDELANLVRRAKFVAGERYGAGPWDLLTQPHITLKSPFDADDVAPFSAYLHRLAAETKAFEVVFGRPTVFEDAVLFYDVEQDERLHALQRRIMDDLRLEPVGHEVTGWHFHITIAETLDEQHAHAARDELDDGREFRFPVAELALWRRVDVAGYWVIFEVASVHDA